MWYTILAVLAAVSALAMILTWYDSSRFVVREQVMESPKVKGEKTFVMLSDLHNKSFGRDNARLIRKIDEICPEYILIAGDMLTAKPGADFTPALTLLNTLASRYTILYGMGNHEHRLELYPEVYGSMSEQYWEALKNPNIIPLRNQSYSVEENRIMVYGAVIERKYYKRFTKREMDPSYLSRTLGKPDPDKFTVLLAHNPEYFPEYAQWGADLVLSGHVHGGIVRLPVLGGVVSPSCRLFPKYDGGVFTEQNSMMILGRGLGGHTIPFRLFNPGELHVIRIRERSGR